MGEISQKTTTATTSRTSEHYASALANDLMQHCLQHTAAQGDLATGGLGVHAYLQYKRAVRLPADHATTTTSPSQTAQHSQQRQILLQNARDACLDYLQHQKSSKSPPISHQRSISIWTNPSMAIHALLAVIYYQLGASPSRVQFHTDSVFAEIKRETIPPSDCELLYGRAGAIQAILFLRQELAKPDLEQELLWILAKDILYEGEQRALHKKRTVTTEDLPLIPPLLWEWKGTPYLGATHGMVGILYTLLGIPKVDLQSETAMGIQDVLPKIQETIEILSFHTFASGNLKVVLEQPSSAPTNLSATDGASETPSHTLIDNHVEWAHGAPGHIWLLLRAHQIYSIESDSSQYLDQALHLAEYVLWARRKSHIAADISQTAGGKSGLGLATGLTGIAYTLLQVHHISQDLVWRQRAEQLTRHMAQYWKDTTHLASNPYSISEGLGGLISLLMDLGYGESQIPFFISDVVVSARKPNMARGSSSSQGSITNLDSEKHIESPVRNPRKATQKLRKRSESGSFGSFSDLSMGGDSAIESDEEEFGDADDEDVPNTSFLQAMQDDCRAETKKAPSASDITPSMLQSKMQSSLDKGEHEDISGFRELSRHSSGRSNNGRSRGVRRTSSASLYRNEIAEFGMAESDDAPDVAYLRELSRDTSVDEDDLVWQVTPSQLEAKISSGLDKEKHEGIGELLDSNHLEQPNKDEDNDEFGVAAEDDAPVSRFLEDSERMNRSILMSGTIPNQRIASLDREKHEGLGELRHSNGTIRSRRSIDDEMAGDEFGNPNADEGVVAHYLDRMRISFNDDMDFTTDDLISHPQEEKEGPRANINILDLGQHEDLGDIMNSRHVRGDKNEFGEAGSKDTLSMTYGTSRHSSIEVGSDDDVEVQNKTEEDLGSDMQRSHVASANAAVSSRGSNPIPRFSKLFLRECLDKCRGEGNLYDGGLGVAAYLRLRRSEYEPRDRRTVTLRTALNNAQAGVRYAVHNQSKKREQCTLLAGQFIGSKCLLAAILHRLGRTALAMDHARDIVLALEVDCSQLSDSDCSLLYGKAGCLHALFFLRQELEDSTIGRDLVLQICGQILLEGLKNGSSVGPSLLSWKWKGRTFLGAACGAVGILSMFLCLTEEEWQCLDSNFSRAKEVVQQSIDSLESLCYDSGNLRVSVDGTEGDLTMDWSHGSPGHVFLLLKSYEVFNDTKYLALARSKAENFIWQRRSLRKGAGLARGVAGIGYVFLALARCDESNRTKWLNYANEIARTAINDIDRLLAPSERPHSLFEGLGGLVCFLMDVQNSTLLPTPFLETGSTMNIPKVAQSRASSLPAKNNELMTPRKTGTATTGTGSVVNEKEVTENNAENHNSILKSPVKRSTPQRPHVSSRPPRQDGSRQTPKSTPDRSFGGAEDDILRAVSELTEFSTPQRFRGPGDRGEDLSDTELFEMMGQHLPKFREGLGALYSFVQRLEDIAETKSPGRKPAPNRTPRSTPRNRFSESRLKSPGRKPSTPSVADKTTVSSRAKAIHRNGSTTPTRPSPRGSAAIPSPSPPRIRRITSP